MKRSALIQKIIDSVYYRSQDDLVLDWDEAEEILKDLEAFEVIVPPASNEWESEDETK